MPLPLKKFLELFFKKFARILIKYFFENFFDFFLPLPLMGMVICGCGRFGGYWPWAWSLGEY